MSVAIDSLLVSSPEIRNGRPRIAGTGITVHRLVRWYKLGNDAEEVARRYAHITVAQVYAALAYYHANRAEIDADLLTDADEGDRLEAEHTERPA